MRLRVVTVNPVNKNDETPFHSCVPRTPNTCSAVITCDFCGDPRQKSKTQKALGTGNGSQQRCDEVRTPHVSSKPSPPAVSLALPDVYVFVSWCFHVSLEALWLHGGFDINAHGDLWRFDMEAQGCGLV